MRPAARRLLRPLWVVLAVVFLIEAWLWDHLQALLRGLVDRLPFARFKAWLAAAIRRLSPWATLVVFVVPFVALLPLKVLEVYLLARHQWVAAVLVVVLAKLLGLGLTAFIFDLTRDKLLQMAWFRWLFERVMALRDWAHALTDPIKERLKRALRLFAPARAGRTLRLLRRLRRRVRAA